MKIQFADRLNRVEEYYFSRKLKEIAALRQSGVDVINLGIGSPDLAPDPSVISTLRAESLRPENHAYQSYSGIAPLREAFAAWYKKYFHVPLDPRNEILPLMGSKEGIMHLSMAFLNPGDEVLVPNPGYPAYAAVARLLGAEVRYYMLDESNHWFPDLEKLDKADLSKVKIMWVNYPNMPTGAKASATLFEKLVDFGLRKNILVVNDNPYGFILNDEHLSLLQVDGAREVAMELNSLSKSHNMAGWRIGMLAGRPDYVQAVLQVKSNMDSGMFKPLQLAAAESLQLQDSWYEQLNAIYRKRREWAYKILEILQCDVNKKQVGMFVWAKIPAEHEGSAQFSDEVLKQTAVFLTPGFIFGSAGERYVRLSLCTKELRLREAAKRMEEIMLKQEKV